MKLFRYLLMVCFLLIVCTPAESADPSGTDPLSPTAERPRARSKSTQKSTAQEADNTLKQQPRSKSDSTTKPAKPEPKPKPAPVMKKGSPISSEQILRKGMNAFQLNYPGVGFRRFFSDRVSWELRGQFGNGVLLVGPRFNRYFSLRNPRCPLFWGVEADYVRFKGDESKGTGYALEVFLGGEYFLQRNASFQMDVGPAFVNVRDQKDTTESSSGVELVINFGFNWYFGKKT